MLRNIPSVSQCFTSAFVFFELVTEITESEKEFACRRGTIVSLMESEIRKEWLLPSDRLVIAFPFLTHKAEHMDQFHRLLSCVIDSQSVQEFERLIADRQLAGYLDLLCHEHSDMVNVAQIIREAPGLHEIAEAIIKKNRPLASKQEKRAMFRRGLEMTSRYYKAIGYPDTIDSFACKAVAQCIPDATENDVQRAVASYDGSLSIFLTALDRALLECQAGCHIPHENDFADLLHLMYLCEGDTLVCEEGDMKLITRAAHSAGISVLRIENLLEG